MSGARRLVRVHLASKMPGWLSCACFRPAFTPDCDDRQTAAQRVAEDKCVGKGNHQPGNRARRASAMSLEDVDVRPYNAGLRKGVSSEFGGGPCSQAGVYVNINKPSSNGSTAAAQQGFGRSPRRNSNVNTRPARSPADICSGAPKVRHKFEGLCAPHIILFALPCHESLSGYRCRGRSRRWNITKRMEQRPSSWASVAPLCFRAGSSLQG